MRSGGTAWASEGNLLCSFPVYCSTSAISLDLKLRALRLWRVTSTPARMPPAARTPTMAHTNGRRQIGGFRTTSCGRGGAATILRPRVRPFPLIAKLTPRLLLQYSSNQDRQFVED